ncbi:hypothetical protein Tco_1227869 [Tanacetum coccineum]
MDKRVWVDGEWCWDWEMKIRGRACKELEGLVGVLQKVVVANYCRDRWKRTLFRGESFKMDGLRVGVELA